MDCYLYYLNCHLLFSIYFLNLDESYANVSKLKTPSQKVDALFEASKKGTDNR